MTRKRSARCVKCYEEMWARYGHRTSAFGDPLVYSYKGYWENVAITVGPRGGYKAKCRNCGHQWRVSLKTAKATAGSTIKRETSKG